MVIIMIIIVVYFDKLFAWKLLDISICGYFQLEYRKGDGVS